MQAWLYEKEQPLAQLLENQGALDPERRRLLEALVEQHVRQHGGNAALSLQAVSSADSVRHELEKMPDPQLHASLVHLMSPTTVGRSGPGDDEDDAERTRSLGTSRSAGTRFRRLRPFAKGGLGEVFVALDLELNREVALKQIHERRADDSESRARFLLEAEITGGLEHPGTVPVYGLGTYADGRPFYAMRFIKGDSLMGAITKYHTISRLRGESSNSAGPARNLALRNLLRRLIDVCNAMQYAHDRGVLHRDLKPGNIMLGKYGETLVVDWGLA
jgi:serine/threonine-protein kinase